MKSFTVELCWTLDPAGTEGQGHDLHRRDTLTGSIVATLILCWEATNALPKEYFVYMKD